MVQKISLLQLNLLPRW